METLLDRLKREPVLISALLVALFNLFGVDAALGTSIADLVAVALPLVLGFMVRQSVTPVGNLEGQV